VESLVPGRTLGRGRFVLERQVGLGGMGQVWLAVDNQMTRAGGPPHYLALKLLSPQLMNEPKAREKLREEVLRGFQLNHENIIRIHSWHEEVGEPAFYAMEYVPGESLAARLNKKPGRRFPWIELAPLAKQLCDALIYAHARRVIHRDLKPANVLVTTEGTLKLADFGLAKVVTADDESSFTVTRAGTPGYSSPQQVQGETPAESDDIYSVGATLYELLTGSRPYFVSDQPPRPISEALGDTGKHDVPPMVRDTIMACLHPEPARRPKSVNEIARDLGLFTTWEQHPAPPPLKRRKVSKVLVAEVCLGVVLAGFGGWLLYHQLVSRKAASQPTAEEAKVPARPPPENPPAVKPEPAVAQERTAPTPTPTTTVQATTEEPPKVTAVAPPPVADEKPTLFPVAGKPWTNSLGMEFLPLNGGAKWLCRWETRVKDLQTYQDETGTKLLRSLSYKQKPEEPVVGINWIRAQSFCAWLTQRDQAKGLLSSNEIYRLPTVAEWRQAAQKAFSTNGAAGRRYWWGEAWPPPSGFGNLAGDEWSNHSMLGDLQRINRFKDGFVYTSPAGTFQSDPYLLADLIGNVWEMCEQPPKNPVGLGGAWDTAERAHLSQEYVLTFNPSSPPENVGFRCLIDRPTRPSSTTTQRGSK
jgi:serine/threonine protein kinase/formylglycine-generating enzyme required for sulfatase activity